MPNNFNSIFNKFFILTLCSFLFSCVSSVPSSGLSYDFNGKMMIKTSNNQNISYHTNIFINENGSIIQIQKPFIGNVMNINLFRNKPAVIKPPNSSEIITYFILKNESNAFNSIENCLLRKESLDKIYDDLIVKCFNKNYKYNIKLVSEMFEIDIILNKKSK
jgi:hypothetical protein